jgi:hypothetical protein
MIRRYFMLLMLISLLVQSALVSRVSAAPSFDDLQGHWAQSEIEFLSKLGIYKASEGHFYPDRPIARGESLALMNRVFETVYGPLSNPKAKASISYKYPLYHEILGLLGNLKAMLDVELGFVSDFEPGEKMLFNLYLSGRKMPMKEPQKYMDTWWMPAEYLQQPLTREEASMMLFHMLAPQKIRVANLKPGKVQSYFDGYYQWKHQSDYPDTKSPYATAIQEYDIFGQARFFEPEKSMTRAQFALVLKRLYDVYEADLRKQFQGNLSRQQKIINVFLTAANLAYQKQDQDALGRYFGKTAQKVISGLAPLPLHDFRGTLMLKWDDAVKNKLWVIGRYEHHMTGKYEIEYLFEPDDSDSNRYGWQITAIKYEQK